MPSDRGDAAKPGPRRVKLLSAGAPTTLEIMRARQRELRAGMAFIAAFLVAWIGAKFHLVRSNGWENTGELVALVPALLAAWYFPRTQKYPDTAHRLMHNAIARAIMFWVIAPVVLYSVSWGVFANAIPVLLTRFAGRSFTEIHVLDTRHENSRAACSYRVTGAPFAADSPKRAYCASPAEFQRLPAHGRMRVRGHESWFGRTYEAVEPVDESGSRAR